MAFLAAATAFAIVGRFGGTIFDHVAFFLAIAAFVVVVARGASRAILHHVTFFLAIPAFVVISRLVRTVTSEVTLLLW